MYAQITQYDKEKIFVQILLILLLFNSVISVASSTLQSQPVMHSDALAVGDPMVDFTLPEFFGGDLFTLSNIASGKLVMLDFMASWCGPCQKAMPEIRDIYHTFQPSGKFEIISIGVDKKASDPDSDMAWFYKTFKIEWLYARDQDNAVNGSERAFHYYGSGSIPTMYLIYEGKVVYEEVGFAGYDAVAAEILKYIPADTTNPTITSTSNTTDNLSILNPSIDVFVRATDNWGISTVTAEYFDESVGLTYDSATGRWVGSIEFKPWMIYNATSVTVNFTAEDTMKNKDSTSASFAVTHVEDNEDPTLSIDTPFQYYTDVYNLVIIATAIDNYEIMQVELLQTYNGTQTVLPVPHTKEDQYKFHGEYPADVNISKYSFQMTATDIAGNSVTIDVVIPPYTDPASITSSTTVVTSTSSEVTSSTSSTVSSISETTTQDTTSPISSTTTNTPLYLTAVVISVFFVGIIFRRRKY